MKVDAQGMLIRKLLVDGKYIIPDYQREYDWEEEQIKEFIDDIGASFTNEDFNRVKSVRTPKASIKARLSLAFTKNKWWLLWWLYAKTAKK